MAEDQDPTALTAQRLERQIEQVRSQSQSQIFSEVGALQKLLETRLDGMDRALSRAEDFPTDLDRMAARLEALFNEKLKAQGDLFDEKINGLRELMTEQRGSATTAVSKSEDAMRAQLASTIGHITALKERVDKTEGKGTGALQLWGLLMVIVVVVIGVAGIVITSSQAPSEPKIQYLPAPSLPPDPALIR